MSKTDFDFLSKLYFLPNSAFSFSSLLAHISQSGSPFAPPFVPFFFLTVEMWYGNFFFFLFICFWIFALSTGNPSYYKK